MLLDEKFMSKLMFFMLLSFLEDGFETWMNIDLAIMPSPW